MKIKIEDLKKSMMGIYKITFPNNKIYIGFVEFVKDKRGKVFNINLYRLFLRLKSWEVGTLLIRVEVLGNESSENRNGYAPFWSKR